MSSQWLGAVQTVAGFVWASASKFRTDLNFIGFGGGVYSSDVAVSHGILKLEFGLFASGLVAISHLSFRNVLHLAVSAISATGALLPALPSS